MVIPVEDDGGESHRDYYVFPVAGGDSPQVACESPLNDGDLAPVEGDFAQSGDPIPPAAQYNYKGLVTYGTFSLKLDRNKNYAMSYNALFGKRRSLRFKPHRNLCAGRENELTRIPSLLSQFSQLNNPRT